MKATKDHCAVFQERRKDGKCVGSKMWVAYACIISTIIAGNSLIFSLTDASFSTYGIHRLDNGNTLVGIAPTDQIINSLLAGGKMQEGVDSVREIDKNGNILWETSGFTWVHDVEMMPDGNVAVASTYTDRFMVVNHTTSEIEWTWNADDIDWEDVKSEWGSDHYYNNPTGHDWTHINDLDFKDHGNWTSCLVSLRNFDLVIELNYTSAKTKINASADDVIWHYGGYQKHHLLHHQHDPNYLSNGNIMIADSDNSRIMEVDYNTKKVAWTFDMGLGWSREADEMSDGRILIGDDDEVLIVNKSTNEVEWRYTHMVMLVYDCDELKNGNILISNNDGSLMEIDPDTNEIAWEYGIRWMPQLIMFNGITFIFLGIVMVIFNVRKQEVNELLDIDFKKWKTARSWFFILSGTFFVFVGFAFALFSAQVLVFIFGFLYAP